MKKYTIVTICSVFSSLVVTNLMFVILMLDKVSFLLILVLVIIFSYIIVGVLAFKKNLVESSFFVCLFYLVKLISSCSIYLFKHYFSQVVVDIQVTAIFCFSILILFPDFLISLIFFIKYLSASVDENKLTESKNEK